LKVSILIPYKNSNNHRKKAFEWVVERYKKLYPEYELVLQKDESKSFHKTRTFNKAFKKSTGDIIVMADADIFFTKELLTKAVSKLNDWIVPYKVYIALNTRCSNLLIRESPDMDIRKFKLQIKTSSMNSVGGLLVLRREVYEAVNGCDERFKGWGCEDTAFARCLKTMYGEPDRLEHNIYHIWHPRARNASIHDGSFEKNKKLSLEYKRAVGDKDAMKLLVEKR